YPLLVVFFFFSSYAHHRDLHSFPTRRSSDLPLPLAAHELHILRAPLHDSGGGRPRSDDGVAAAARRGRILLARRLAHRLRAEPSMAGRVEALPRRADDAHLDRRPRGLKRREAAARKLERLQPD